MQERKPGCICQLDEKTGEPVDPNYGECPVHKPDAITPKDTAIELINKYKPLVTQWDCYHDVPAEIMIDSKKCANICVDEILSVLDTFQTHEYAKVLIPHYRQVKEEIKSL